MVKKMKNCKILILCIMVTLVIGCLSVCAFADDSTPSVQPRATSVQYGEYNLDYQTTIPSSIGYFELDVLFFCLGDTHESGVAAPWGRIKWDLSTRTLSIFTYPDFEELVVYRDGTWLSRDVFSIYVTSTSTNASTTYVDRFSTLFKWKRNSDTVFNAQSLGYNFGSLDGYNFGYNLGYDTGYTKATEDSQPFSNIIGDIFKGLDNFVIFADFSILDIIKAIMGIFLAVWLLKLIAGG